MSDSLLIDGAQWLQRLLALEEGDQDEFDAMFREAVQYQRGRNPVYDRYCSALGDPDMPFLPIEAFKREAITTFPIEKAKRVFESSGTGQGIRSRHYVRDLALYESVSGIHFERVFGSGPFTLLAHLPHYSRQGNRSSLIYMLEHLITRVGDEDSRFFLDEVDEIERLVGACREKERALILFGAAFGLLALADKQRFTLPRSSLIIETGGMKTYRQEISRAALHRRLAGGFGLDLQQVWSEYGMCELMSQCYTRGASLFYPPPWMRVRILNPENPFESLPEGKTGALAVIDLANIYSVCAILTEDKAVQRGSGFEVTGRLKGAELRGCNFLMEQHI